MLYSVQDMHYLLGATFLKGIGGQRLRAFIDYFGELKHIFTTSQSDLQKIGMTSKDIQSIQNLDWDRVFAAMEWGERTDCHIIGIDHEFYPPLLREINSPPLVLFAQGNIHLLKAPQLAIVGSRNPTVTGRELAFHFAAALVKAGLVITSGLAIGIDGESHNGALHAGGATVAVCGNGLNTIYPSRHKNLAESIKKHGVLVSEFPPETLPKAKFFPMRNRIISGMSLGVLVVEAAIRSGSLVTARFAVEQGREVFALPGSVHNPLARGCHELIKQGARLVETAEEILRELDMLKDALNQSHSTKKKQDLPFDLHHLLKQIGYEITSLDAIIMRSGLVAGDVSSMLLSLELMGYIHREPGGYVRCA